MEINYKKELENLKKISENKMERWIIADILKHEYENPIDYIKEVLSHGCSGIATNLIYYTETTKFHDKFEKETWDLLYDSAQDQGFTVMEFISSLNGSTEVNSIEQFKNLLTWFSYEETCMQILNKLNIEI